MKDNRNSLRDIIESRDSRELRSVGVLRLFLGYINFLYIFETPTQESSTLIKQKMQIIRVDLSYKAFVANTCFWEIITRVVVYFEFLEHHGHREQPSMLILYFNQNKSVVKSLIKLPTTIFTASESEKKQ